MSCNYVHYCEAKANCYNVYFYGCLRKTSRQLAIHQAAPDKASAAGKRPFSPKPKSIARGLAPL
ncbi:MAG: hypothetical protein J6U14_04515 [Bacteroidaceae bacterium]|nr:hypothetical protein [Bacteroidaceae bacterium]